MEVWVMARGAFPADEKGMGKGIIKKAITGGDLENGGKLKPAQGLPGGSGIDPRKDPKAKKPTEVSVTTKGTDETTEGDIIEVEKSYFVEFAKAIDEERTVTGVVLQPEIVDAHGDIMSAKVIKEAAHNFLAKFNKATKLGLMHKDFTKNFELLESFVAPVGFVLGGQTIKEGSWIMTVRVKSASIWKKVKEGKIRGFSIGGKARVRNIAA